MIKVGIDLGNSKISCVVCDININQKPRVLSFVSLPTSNINRNTFTNFQSIKNEVKEIIDLAAKESQTEIKSINLNVPLYGSDSLFYNSQIDIENELISELHIKKAINQSEFFNEPINKYVLMNFILNYEIDNELSTGSPIGNFAKKYVNSLSENELCELESLLNTDDEILYKWYLNQDTNALIPVNNITKRLKKFKL